MVNVFQTSTGYRDPSKTLTIKALEARMKALQDAAQKSSELQQPISNPWQGAAYLGNMLASGIQESRAENADIAARQQLAQIRAGIDPTKGATQQQIAQWGMLDPEGANQAAQDQTNYLHEMAKLAETQKYQTGERLGTEQFQTQQAANLAQTQKDAAAALAQTQEAAAQAAGERTTAEKVREEQAAPGVEAAKIAAETQARTKVADDLGLKEGTSERNQLIATGSMPIPIANTPAGIDAANKYYTRANGLTSSLNKLNRAKDLLARGQVIQGDVWNKMLNTAAKFGPGGLEHAASAFGFTMDQVRATQEANAILNLNAMEQMSNTLAGADSDRDVQNFKQDLASPNFDPQVRIGQINTIIDHMQQDLGTTRAGLKAFGADPGKEYSWTPSTTIPPANAAAGGGGGGRSVPPAIGNGVKVTIQPPQR